MRFMRLPILMVVIALASSVSTEFSFLLRFGGLALATLTVLGALSDMNGAARRASGMTRDDLLRLWFGGKLRERHTWEALTDQVNALASALRLPPPPTLALPAPNPLTNGHRASRKKAPKQAIAEAAVSEPAAAAPPRSLGATLPLRGQALAGTGFPHSPPVRGASCSRWSLARLRLLGIEALTEIMVIATIALNWFRPAPNTTMGEQLALLVLGLLALGLLWFDWRLVRRFVAAVQHELIRLSPQASSKVTSSS
jgi:hypothetical protein